MHSLLFVFGKAINAIKNMNTNVHTPTKYGIWLICNSVTVALKWTEASYFLVFELVTFSCLLIKQKKAFARTQK